PPPGLPSSVCPLQSLSAPSHISGDGCTFWLHTIIPPELAIAPAAQTPGSPVLQPWPPPGSPSSVWPLQSLSTPSHISGDGCTFWLHTSIPLVHALVPAAQTPGSPVLQSWPPPGSPSSVWPLQSLSTPSHISGDGCTFWLHTIIPP